MAILSIVLSVVAVVCTLLGFLTTPIPVVGAVVSFGAAAIALGGIMLGGKALSNAKKQAQTNDVARIGVVLNVLAFVPALLVAITCGLCNAVVSTGNLQMNRNFHVDLGQPSQAPDDTAPADGQDPQAAGQGAPQPLPDGQPVQQQPVPARPSTLPPPPLPAGPRK